MCLKFGRDTIFVSAGDIFGLVLFWICFVGLGFFYYWYGYCVKHKSDIGSLSFCISNRLFRLVNHLLWRGCVVALKSDK